MATKRVQRHDFHIRLSDEERQAIAEAAQKEDRTPASFIRYHIMQLVQAQSRPVTIYAGASAPIPFEALNREKK